MPEYIEPQRVRNYTGVAPRQLDLADDTALDVLLREWIGMAQEMVGEHLKVEWDELDASGRPDIIVAPVPKGVKIGVLRIVANMVAQAKIRRQGNVLNIDEFRQQLIPDEVFTDSIKSDLALYEGGGRRHRETQRTVETEEGKKFGFSMIRVRKRKELERDAAWYPTYDRRR